MAHRDGDSVRRPDGYCLCHVQDSGGRWCRCLTSRTTYEEPEVAVLDGLGADGRVVRVAYVRKPGPPERLAPSVSRRFADDPASSSAAARTDRQSRHVQHVNL